VTKLTSNYEFVRKYAFTVTITEILSARMYNPNINAVQYKKT